MKKILLADNDESIVKMVETFLRSRGFEVTSVDDGLKALEEIKKDKPDLVILDIMMPGMDGVKVSRMLKGDVKTAKVPIIFITALQIGPEEEDEMLKQAQLLTKPFKTDELMNKILEVM